MSTENWRKKIPNEDPTALLDQFEGIEEHLMIVVRELGAAENGDAADSALCLSQVAQALCCLDCLGAMMVALLEGRTEGSIEHRPLEQVTP